MAVKKDGLIFYKLNSDYNNDTTKNCGLEGLEVDSNFFFLRGMDIADFGVEEDTGIIYFTRVNGEKIVGHDGKGVPVNHEFRYDEENGVLTVIYPSGVEKKIEGFLCDKDMSLGTSEKFTGKGTIASPLDINHSYETGTYKPVIEYIDLTQADAKMPEEPGMNNRYVTKENVDVCGYYYTFDEVKRINKMLEGTEWRVPTISDWNNMLNSLECSDVFKDEGQCFVWTGERAGKMAKSGPVIKYDEEKEPYQFDYWNKMRDEDETEGERDESGLSILPLGGYPETTDDLDGLGQYSILWSSSSEHEDDKGDIQVKYFRYDNNGVKQLNYGPDSRFQLRLVKDYTGFNDYGSEVIGGKQVFTNTIKDCKQIWTKTNISVNPTFGSTKEHNEFAETNGKLINAVKEKFPEIPSDVKYFLNEWDGEKWFKVQMEEGDSVVIISDPEKKDNDMHEWRLINGELVDTAVALKNEFNEEFKKINDSIDTKVNDLEESLTKKIDTDIDNASLALNQTIEEVNQSLAKKVSDLDANLDEVNTSLTNSITTLSNDLNTAIKDTEKRILTATEERIGAIDETYNERCDNIEKSIKDNKENIETYVDETISFLKEAHTTDIKVLDGKIDSVNATLGGKIDENYKELDSKIATSAQDIDSKITGATASLKSEIESSSKALNSRITSEVETLKAEDVAIKNSIEANKVIPESEEGGIDIIPGEIVKSEEETTITNTTIKVRLPEDEPGQLPNHIKSDEGGLYFDGFFGNF